MFNVFANVKSNARKLTRKEEKEMEKINKRFNALCDDFEAFLFSVDWDDEGVIEVTSEGETIEIPIKDYNPFDYFNENWRDVSNYFNKKRGHITPVNGGAFHELMINNKNIDTNGELININNPQLVYNCWIV